MGLLRSTGECCCKLNIRIKMSGEIEYDWKPLMPYIFASNVLSNSPRTSGGEYLYLATATLLNCGRDELLLSETFGAVFLDELCQSRSSRLLRY